MKIPAIDKGETVEVLPSCARSLAVCVTLEDKHGSWVSWFSPANARKLADQLVRAADSIRPARKRTDSERYAELRALVEAWQTVRSASEQDRASIPPAVSTLTANPTGQPEGWLSRYMDTCAAETSLAEWNHR